MTENEMEKQVNDVMKLADSKSAAQPPTKPSESVLYYKWIVEECNMRINSIVNMKGYK